MTNVTMFSLHSALALELMAAMAASFLLVIAWHWGAEAKKLGTILGGVGLMIAAVSMSCTVYYGIAYWNEGVFSPASVKSQSSVMENMSSMHDMRQNVKPTRGEGGSGGAPRETDKSAH